MRTQKLWGTWLLAAAALTLVPADLFAQGPTSVPQAPFGVPGMPGSNTGTNSDGFGTGTGYAPPDAPTPLPTGSTRPEDGGPFVALDFLYWRQTNILRGQNIAFYGFVDVDGSINQALRGTNTPGVFFGPRTLAFDVSQVSGPNDYEPGFRLSAGYRFGDGSALTYSWTHLFEHRTQALVSTVAPIGLQFSPDFTNSFITAFVFNFPGQYSGAGTAGSSAPAPNVGVGNPLAAYGIWNAAGLMIQEFIQRFEGHDLLYRFPVYENEDYRLSGIGGASFAWIWEGYKWTTVDIDINGDSGPDTTAIYRNVTSNRMYGFSLGCSQECYLGHGFAAQIDILGSMYIDFVREKSRYNLGAKFVGPISKRTKSEWSPVPSAHGILSTVWYPIEGVQISFGYDALAFFNTLGAPQPIDFNYSSVSPKYEHIPVRLLDGLTFSISFSF
jgi:hypothetical protein